MQEVELTWAGGEHSFRLTLGGLRAVQEASDAGPQEILQRYVLGTWRVDDVLGVLRHGLEGAGMEKSEARHLIGLATDAVGLLQLVPVAQTVLAASLLGVKDDPVGEPQGVSPSPENGASASFTGTEPLPGSPPETSTP